ncbi:uncharacterized protein LOC134722818 [Mytilus trossulus]|uniref:uncharacterized protein LOC134722818 n=1 Tax=Mytilus trossulus TaxID=6551 RepID=UPI00300635FC
MTATPTQPTLTLRPNNPFVGDTITVTCNSTVQRWPGDISARLSYQFHTENDRGEFNNNRYVMNNLTKLDNGTTISCQATDDLGKVSNMSNTVLLDPFYGPENVAVEPSITNINITEGTTLGPLYCIATCNPECNYIWKQNMTDSSKVTEFWLRSNNESYGLINPPTFNFNEEVKVEMKLRVESNPDPQIMFNSTLLKIQPIHKGKQYIDYISNIPSLKCEESGNFSIQASNGIPYADTRTVNLNIYCKPRNATAKSGTIRTKIGTKENIVLNVTAFTAPNVTWLRETNFEWNVLNERYDYKHKLNSTIHIKTKDDFGSYGIKICNKLGCIVENITLKPQDKPEAPKNFSVKKATFQSVNISWIAGFDGGHKQTFWVKYKAKDDTKWDKKDVPSSNIKSGRTVYFTLDQLKPDTKYQVTVVSKNIKGQRNTSLDFKTEVQPTVKSPSKSASMTPIFIGIGCGFAVILMIITSVYVFFKRRHKASTSELAESNVLYAVVDKVQQKFKRRNMENEDSNMSNEPANAEYASVVKPKSKSKKVHYKEDEIETANDEYAVVDKSKRKINFTDDDTTYANQGDADLLIRQPSKKKPSGRSKNQDGLTYIEVSFTRKPKDRRRIIGAENRTNYVDIDFTRTADPLPETADE